MPFLNIESTYPERQLDSGKSINTWKEFASVYPPSAGLSVRDKTFLPSTLLTLQSGDLGLSMLWIVQATLIRALLNDLLKTEGVNPHLSALLGKISDYSIGAMAHSENKNNPVIIERKDGITFITGMKKYVTGGLHADFILLTAREKPDEKITWLAYIPSDILPEGALSDLMLKTLRTINHASLSMENMPVPEENIFHTEPSALRRVLKKWSIIERSLIIEAYIGLLVYLALKLNGISGGIDNRILDMRRLLEDRNIISKRQIGCALAGKHIDEEAPDIVRISDHSGFLNGLLSSGNKIPPDLAARLSDLNMFSLLKIQ
jgi:hypothetical protein